MPEWKWITSTPNARTLLDDPQHLNQLWAKLAKGEDFTASPILLTDDDLTLGLKVQVEAGAYHFTYALSSGAGVTDTTFTLKRELAFGQPMEALRDLMAELLMLIADHQKKPIHQNKVAH